MECIQKYKKNEIKSEDGNFISWRCEIDTKAGFFPFVLIHFNGKFVDFVVLGLVCEYQLSLMGLDFDDVTLNKVEI